MWARSTFNLQDGTDIPSEASISSVVVAFRYRETDSNGQAQLILRLSGTETTSTVVNMTTAWQNNGLTVARPGGGGWSVSDLAALQAGMWLRTIVAGPHPRVTQLWIEVHYTAATTTSIMRPSGVGDFSEFVPDGSCTVGWACVDEVSADGDTTNVFTTEGKDTTDLDAYTLSDNNIPETAKITQVEVFHRGKKEGAGGIHIPFVRLNGVETVQPHDTNVAASYVTYSYILARPGGGAWQRTDLDDLQAGVKMRSNPAGVGNETRLTQLYVLVSYVAPLTVTFTPITANATHSVRMIHANETLAGVGPMGRTDLL